MIHGFDKHFENNHNFETEYLRILYYDLAKDYKDVYKSYQYNRLCTIISGKKHVEINDSKEFEYTNSEFLLLPPNSSVKMDIKEKTIAVVYELSDKLIEDTKNHVQIKHQTDLKNIDNDIVKEKLQDNIKSTIQRINTYCMSDDPNKSFLIDLSSKELTYNLIKNHFIPVNNLEENSDPVNYTMNYLQNNVNNIVSINEIASILNMSASNLIYSFKKRTSMTPKEYHNILKLKKSKEELKYKNVTEVCYELGFESVSYFIKLFKHYYKETPKQFAMRMNQLYKKN